MADDFALRLDGMDAAERAIFSVHRRAGGADMTELFDRIGLALETTTIERFDLGRDPDGKSWVPSQRVRKGAVGEHGPVKLKTGIISGRLRQSVTHRASASQVEVGTNVVYGRRFQLGFQGEETVKAHKRRVKQLFGRMLKEPMEVAVGSHKRTANQPARAFVGLSTEDREEIVALGEDWLAEIAEVEA